VKAKLVLAAVTAALVVGGVWSGAPARAQTSNGAPSLSLAGQDPWVPADGTFTMQLRTSDVPEGLNLTLTVHDRLLSRSAFDATIDATNPPLGQTLTLLRLPLDFFQADASGVRTVSVRLRDDLNLRRSGNGVYPVEVQLRDSSDQTLAGFVTHLIVADLTAGTQKPLDVAWVWPLVADPAFGFENTADPAVAAQLSATGRLGRQAALIGSDTDVPLTLAPSPETMDAWSTLGRDDPSIATGVTRLTGAALHHQVLSAPFVPLDLPAIFDGGLGGTMGAELDRGDAALQAFFGSHIDPSTTMPGPLDTRSLDGLKAAVRTRLVVEGSALEPNDSKFTASRPALLARAPDNPAETVTIVATDPGLERFLEGDQAPALRAARLLAALAVIAGEQPSLARAVAFANPRAWDASDEFVHAVLAGLRGNPILRPVTVDTLLAETPVATVNDEPEGERVVRALAPVKVRKPPVTASQYYEALQARQGIAALFGETDARVAHADRVLLSSLADSYEGRAGRRRARDQLHAIGQSGRDFLLLIRTPGRSTVTLTASSAQIPLTFRNDADREVPIHLSLASDKLLFPDGADRDVLLQPGKNQTVRIAVETRSSGTFPMVMTVTTAGGLPIQTSEVTVRSSFVSGVGVFLTVGAVVFLALWWGWDIRRRRHRRRMA
jgi:hypothetical protein